MRWVVFLCLGLLWTQTAAACALQALAGSYQRALVAFSEGRLLDVLDIASTASLSADERQVLARLLLTKLPAAAPTNQTENLSPEMDPAASLRRLEIVARAGDPDGEWLTSLALTASQNGVPLAPYMVSLNLLRLSDANRLLLAKLEATLRPEQFREFSGEVAKYGIRGEAAKIEILEVLVQAEFWPASHAILGVDYFRLPHGTSVARLVELQIESDLFWMGHYHQTLLVGWLASTDRDDQIRLAAKYVARWIQKNNWDPSISRRDAAIMIASAVGECPERVLLDALLQLPESYFEDTPPRREFISRWVAYFNLNEAEVLRMFRRRNAP